MGYNTLSSPRRKAMSINTAPKPYDTKPSTNGIFKSEKISLEIYLLTPNFHRIWPNDVKIVQSTIKAMALF